VPAFKPRTGAALSSARAAPSRFVAGLTEAFTIDAVVVNIAGPNRFGLEVSSPDAIRELRDALNIEFAPDDLGTDDPTAVGFAPS